MAGKKTGKRLLTWVLVLVMALSLLPLNALAARNSTVVLQPSVGSTVTGVKVKVGDTISGYNVKSISGYDITVDLGKYNVNNDTFRLPYARISGQVLTTTKSTTSAGPEAAATNVARAQVPCLPTARTLRITISKARPFC